MAPSPLRTRAVDPARASAWLQFLGCCFLAICGVRMYLVEKFASSIAYGDDLDGIARRILLPWQHGTLSWSALVAAHNGDHRIFATRLWEMLWFAINGTWDPKLVMIVKVPIFAAAATIFIHLLVGKLERYRFLTAAALTALFAFPFAFANALWAFQSQFDFFFLVAALAWLCLLRGRTVVALVLAAGSILTLGSGPIVAASFVPFFLAQWLEKRWSAGRTAMFTAAALVVMAIGLASPTKEAMPHTGTPVEKASTLVRLYGWPYSNLFSIVERLPESEKYVPGPLLRYPSPDRSVLLRAADVMHRHPGIPIAIDAVFAALVVIPTVLLLAAVLRRRIPLSVAVGPLGIAGFAFLMIAATAVARANQVTIMPRFLDHVALAGFVSLASAVVLLARTGRGYRWFAAWAVVLGFGYVATMAVTTAQMSRRSPQAALEVLQRYYATHPHDHAAMTDGENFHKFIISDDPTQFMSELDTPGLERVLPLEVTDPHATLGAPARAAFVVGRYGWVLAVLAAMGALGVAVRSRRSLAAQASLEPAAGTNLVGA